MKRYIKAAKTIEDYEQMGVFDDDQMRWIRRGLEEGVDVSIYADPKYNADQMLQIFVGLKNGVDVSWYADPKYDKYQMLMIYQGLEKGLDVSVYADPKYSWKQMKELRENLKEKKNRVGETSKEAKDVKSKIIQTIKSDGLDSEYCALLGDKVIEVATQELDLYSWAYLKDVVKSFIEDPDYYDDPTDISQIKDAALDVCFESVGSHHAFEIPDMIDEVKYMREKFAGTSEPIYFDDEYSLNDFYDDVEY